MSIADLLACQEWELSRRYHEAAELGLAEADELGFRLAVRRAQFELLCQMGGARAGERVAV